MSAFAGTWRLTRLALHRDRYVLTAWVLGLGAFVAATTAMFVSSLAVHADLLRETQLVATNAGMRMLGLTSGASVGGYMLHREFVTLAVLAAMMSTLAVVRHTRQNEELGRAEVVGSCVVGRYAGLVAAVVVALVAEAALAVAVFLAVLVNGLPAYAALLTGLSVAAVGVVFVGVAAVTCQLSSTSRGAIGMASGVLAVSFLLSGIGNMLGDVDDAGLRVTSAWPVWLSPIGWGQQMRPFGGAQAWPLVLFAMTTVGLVLVAASLVRRRDLGRGLWAERRGHARAVTTLLSPAGLAWRLQRGVLLGWAVGLLGFGLIFGALTEQISDVTGPAAEWYTRTGGSDVVVDAYQTTIIAMAGMFVSLYVVQVMLRMHTDEAGGTLESVLATGATRTGWVGAHLVVAGAGAVLLLLVFTIPMGLATGGEPGGPTDVTGRLALAGLVQLPGVMVLAALVVAAVGLLPRWAVPVSWSLAVAAIVVGPMFGPSLDLPAWLQDLSPFTHTPKVPATDPAVAPLLALVLVAGLLVAVGTVALRRRTLLLPA